MTWFNNAWTPSTNKFSFHFGSPLRPYAPQAEVSRPRQTLRPWDVRHFIASSSQTDELSKPSPKCTFLSCDLYSYTWFTSLGNGLNRFFWGFTISSGNICAAGREEERQNEAKENWRKRAGFLAFLWRRRFAVPSEPSSCNHLLDAANLPLFIV